MNIWHNLSFRIKALILVLVLISMGAVIAFRYQILVEQMRELTVSQATQTMLNGHKNEIKHIVDMEAQTLAAATENMNNKEQVRETFRNLVQKARYLPDQSGYMFIYEKGGTVFVHPLKPELEKKNIIKLKDANGKLLIQELDQAALGGGGFVEYLWDKPNQGVQPKLSYARMIPGGKYWIGTGIYIDDINNEKQAILQTTNKLTNAHLQSLYIMLGIIAFVIVLPLTLVIIRSILKPINELTAAADEFSRGNMDITIPYTDRREEIGKLAMALKRLGMSVKVALSSM